MATKEDTSPFVIGFLMFVLMVSSTIIWGRNISTCNEKVKSNILGIRSDGDFSCFYDVSYSVGQERYERSVRNDCPSPQFNRTHLDLCYSHFKPGKCSAMDGYLPFLVVMALFSISAAAFSIILCIIMKHTCFKQSSIAQQIQVAPVWLVKCTFFWY